MYQNYIKRFIDIIISIISLPFIIMVFIPIAILIKLEDGGAVFYSSIRIGKNGVPFKMFKFRSMKVNAPDLRLNDGSTYNAKDDPRVTKIGKFIRETSIDELPQILNIFLGQMSFIGPRPDLNSHEDLKENYKVILRVRPGITGYTQAFFRNEINWSDKIKYDKYYADNLTLSLDIRIFFQTIYTVLKREKMYRQSN